jgi:hypothetical protein
MKRISVISSNLCSIGYDDGEKILEIEFKNGSIYQYFGVPIFIYNSLLNSTSKGSYCHQNIKGKYQFRRVG